MINIVEKIVRVMKAELIFDGELKYHGMEDYTGKSSASDLIRAFRSGHPNLSKAIYIAWEEGNDIMVKILYKENES